MFTVNEIAKSIGGTVLGNGEMRIGGLATPAFSDVGDMTFAFSETELSSAQESKASCILVPFEVKDSPKTVLQVKDIKSAMMLLYNAMLEARHSQIRSIHPSAIIAKSAKIGKDVTVGPNVVIEDYVIVGDNTIISAGCVIGKHTIIGKKSWLYPNVTIYGYTVIGDRVLIHSGAVIGADGFGYIFKDGKYNKVPQVGNVNIGDDVEIGANSCIDRGTFATTTIGKGTKIDNQVQIAHNVKIGENVVIAGQCGLGGSASVGDFTMIGGKVGISDHVQVGKNVKIGAGTGILGKVRDGESIFGYPERPAEEAKKLHGLMSVLLKRSKQLRLFLRTLPEEEEGKGKV